MGFSVYDARVDWVVLRLNDVCRGATFNKALGGTLDELRYFSEMRILLSVSLPVEARARVRS